jgi:REP element-mobilizing transposase RayT
MTDPPWLPTVLERQIILAAIEAVCEHRNWILLAAHVRSNHVYAVVESDAKPERIMHDFKAYSTRALGAGGKRWTRHGSTRYLWTPNDIADAIRCVAEGQGQAMAAL